MRPLLALVCCLPLLAPGLAGATDDHAKDAHDHEHHGHVSELEGLRVVHAWTRATDGATALVFLEIENGSTGEAVLLGGEADFAKAVTLVGFHFVGGEPVFDPLPKLPVSAGGEAHLSPDGLALRLEGLTHPLKTDDVVEMEVEFARGHLEVDVQVEPANATTHRHAGHSH